MTQHDTVKLVPGDFWRVLLELRDSDGTAPDYSTHSIEECVLAYPGGTFSPSVDTSDSANGNFTLTAPETDTENVPIGKVSTLRLQLANASDEEVTVYWAHVEGVLTLATTEVTAYSLSVSGDLINDGSPQLGGMLDVNGFGLGDGTRELLTFTENGLAVNHLNIANAATGSGPTLSAAGDDANIDLNLIGKGTGQVVVGSGLSVTGAFTSLGIDDNALATAMTLAPSGSVGIGTGTPDGMLHISGSGNVIIAEHPSGKYTQMWSGTGGSIISYDDTGYLALGSASAKGQLVSEQMRLTSSGDLGIGTTSPTNKMEVWDNAGLHHLTFLGSGGSDEIAGYFSAETNPRFAIGRDAVVGGGGAAGITFVNAAYGDNSMATAGAGIGAASGGTSRLGFYTSNGTALAERMRIDNSGNVGIGMTNPVANLHINSAGTPYIQLDASNGSGSAVRLFSSGDTSYLGTANSFKFNLRTGSTDRVTIDTVGNVGIGTTSPATLLDVNGDVNVSGNFSSLGIDDNALSTALTIDSSGNVGLGTTNPILRLNVQANGSNNAAVFQGSSGGAVSLGGNSTSAGRIQGYNNDTFSASAALALNPDGGDVGIGIAAPDGRLHIHSASAGAVTANSTYNDLVIEKDNNAAISFLVPDNRISAIIFGSATDNVDGWLFYDHANFFKIGVADGDRLTIDRSGNVGIGTTSPGELLDVNGDVNISGNLTSLGIDDNAVATALTIDSSGYVGIGTTAPAYPLHIHAPGTGSGDHSRIHLTTGDSGATASDGLTIGYDADGWSRFIARDGTGIDLKTIGAVPVTFGTSNSERMRIADDGDVGIGITNPTAKLDVAGNIVGQDIISKSGYVFRSLGDAYLRATGNLFLQTNSGTTVLYANTLGNVGIGESNPLANLVVAGSGGTSHAEHISVLDTDAQGVDIGGAIGFGGNYTDAGAVTTWAGVKGGKDSATSGEFGGYLAFFTRTNGSGLNMGTSHTAERMRIDAFGNVGIGADNPGARLQIDSPDGAPGLILNGARSNGYIAEFTNVYGTNAHGLLLNVGNDSTDFIIRAQNTAGDVEALSVKADGSVGIGTTIPSEKLHVHDDASGGLRISSNNWVEINLQSDSDVNAFDTLITQSPTTGDLDFRVPNSGDLYIQRSTGNVGVGTQSPGHALDVDGAIRSSGAGGISYWIGNTRAIRNEGGAGGTVYLDLGTINVRDGNGASANAQLNVYGGGYFTGNVGIGTTTPGSIDTAQTASTNRTFLSVHDSGNHAYLTLATGAAVADGSVTSGIQFGATNETAGHGIKVDLLGLVDGATAGQEGGALAIRTKPNGTSALAERVRIDSSGNVGVGTTGPAARLHVYSGAAGLTANAAADDFVIENNGDAGLSILSPATDRGIIFFGSTSSPFNGRIQYDHAMDEMSFSTALTDRMIIDGGGNVGIGTTTPAEKLTVAGGHILLEGPSGSNIPQLQFKRYDSADIDTISKTGDGLMQVDARWRVSGGSEGAPGLSNVSDTNTGLYWPTGDHLSLVTGGSERIRIDSSGNVGIATTSPGAELDVNGNVIVSGTITLKEQSVDPADPAEGESEMWLSDGTASGDEGDIMAKVTVGGVTKTITLGDYSAAP